MDSFSMNGAWLPVHASTVFKCSLCCALLATNTICLWKLSLEWGINQISKTVLTLDRALKGVLVSHRLGCIYWVSLRTCSTEFQDTEFQESSLASIINWTLQRSKVWEKGFLWLGDNPKSCHTSLSFLYFPVSFTYAASNLGEKHSAGNTGKCLSLHSPESSLWENFSVHWGKQKPCCHCKNQILNSSHMGKNNKLWYRMQTLTLSLTHWWGRSEMGFSYLLNV